MPRGTRRTSYVRDNRGRFASTPGGGAPKRPPAKRVSRGTNRLTRDNSGRITSVGGNGATARGGRLRTGAGNLRARQTMAVLSNGRMASVPKGTIGRTRKQREITMIDRPTSQRQAYNEGRAKQMAAIAARKAPKASAPGRIKAGRQESAIRNTTGQSKTLNKFNSRPVGTKVIGRGGKLVPSPTRVPLRVAGPGSKGSDRAFGRTVTKAARVRAASAGRKAGATAAKKPVGWMQSPEARKDRVQQAADRKGYAKKLRTLPKDARRAMQVERLARRQKGIVVAGSTASQLTNIAEARVRLIGNVGKRKDKLTPGQIGAMARTMSESARRLKVGMATGRRGRMRYNPNALQIATGTAARKIRGARIGGVARKGKATPSKPAAPKRVTAARPAGAIAKTTRAGLKLGKNADGKFAWFSRDGKQRTGAYKTKREAQKSPEIEGKEQAARFKVRAKSSTKAKMDQKDYQNADSKWGKLSVSQIEKMIQRDTAAARSLQNNREFTGNNTRRYGPAMANQGAREALESARQAGRYLSERRVRKPRRKP
jgi:hypothetical protein